MNEAPDPEKTSPVEEHCPFCGSTLVHERCKVVCKSPVCGYRIIYTCAEF